MFWEAYRKVEKGTKVTLDEFKSNSELKSEVKEGIIELYNEVLGEARKLINKSDDEELFLELFKNNIIDSYLLQELIDIANIIKNLSKVDEEVLYSLLVRIMEDLEELFYSVKKFLN
ncbi:hypothetical protein [Acidianus sp. HS-5]|uniref:hypothetical protein n=1 Tax=Acidianus sp. HS-5 TaxID=2886040 RepID=UPI001F473C89|nr:hypothetical protein [Acidianus sp. HS-5]BDC18339.1 hypothetical protein HS5_12290 [Acidianus sp. HS-5]